jgi:diguanylate cyclase (GGDEF)-like protein
MLIDIDHFKAINDQYGHDAGDEVLREVAQVLARCSEIRATVARIGGEEFALLGTADELTTIFARRLLAEMRHHAMPGGLKVTISIGMAEGRIANEADWNRLFKAADEALYAAKQGGRDRVREAKGGDAAIAAAA